MDFDFIYEEVQESCLSCHDYGIAAHMMEVKNYYDNKVGKSTILK